MLSSDSGLTNRTVRARASASISASRLRERVLGCRVGMRALLRDVNSIFRRLRVAGVT
jgi:hypothetical protein